MISPMMSTVALLLCLVPQGRAQLTEQFVAANPGVSIIEREGRIARVYGGAFSQGATAVHSADAFLQNNAAMFGVQPAHLVPADAWQVQPILYLPETDTYKFTGFAYKQQLNGVPVFRSALRLLVRNQPDNPLVLASVDLRDLGVFKLPKVAAAAAPASTQAAIQRAGELTIELDQPQMLSTRRVIWAGVEDMIVAPRLADETIVGIGVDKWLVLTDAQTGAVLFEESQIYTVDIVGTVEGNASEDGGADPCENEVATPIPYLLVSGPSGLTVTAADGSFTLPNNGAGSATVVATLNGQWFDVTNVGGVNTVESVIVTPPGPANLLFNSANTSEQVRAEINAYVYANKIRDWVLQYNPAYPTLNFQNFQVFVNRVDGFCPGNAWYDGNINFCLSSGGLPNTAFSSVIYHEYGHHLVGVGGSGQCQYGEGMSDVVSVLIQDDPNIGLGFGGNCAFPLRDADNTCQYSAANCTSNCGGPCHSCGRNVALSGQRRAA